MTKQDIIIEKLDRIIQLLEGKNNSQPLVTFVKANSNADDNKLKDREKEIFQMLDNVK